MSQLPYDALGGIPLSKVHDWMVERIMAMSELFDKVFAQGITFRGKIGYDGTQGSDVVGTADKALQNDFVAAFRKRLAGWGLIAEEDGLRIRPGFTTPWGPIVVTIDPVDGTRQLKRIVENPDVPRQGVSIMIAIRLGGRVIAAYIFDLFTKELFFVSPGSSSPVIRQLGNDVGPIVLPASGSMRRGVLLMHGNSAEHRELNAWLQTFSDAPFAQRTTTQESLGLAFLKLVQGKVVAMARRPGGYFTPWDDSPLIRFREAANIHTYWIKPRGVFDKFDLWPLTQAARREFGVLYLPNRFVGQISAL